MISIIWKTSRACRIIVASRRTFSPSTRWPTACASGIRAAQVLHSGRGHLLSFLPHFNLFRVPYTPGLCGWFVPPWWGVLFARQRCWRCMVSYSLWGWRGSRKKQQALGDTCSVIGLPWDPTAEHEFELLCDAFWAISNIVRRTFWWIWACYLDANWMTSHSDECMNILQWIGLRCLRVVQLFKLLPGRVKVKQDNWWAIFVQIL